MDENRTVDDDATRTTYDLEQLRVEVVELRTRVVEELQRSRHNHDTSADNESSDIDDNQIETKDELFPLIAEAEALHAELEALQAELGVEALNRSMLDHNASADNESNDTSDNQTVTNDELQRLLIEVEILHGYLENLRSARPDRDTSTDNESNDVDDEESRDNGIESSSTEVTDEVENDDIEAVSHEVTDDDESKEANEESVDNSIESSSTEVTDEVEAVDLPPRLPTNYEGEAYVRRDNEAPVYPPAESRNVETRRSRHNLFRRNNNGGYDDDGLWHGIVSASVLRSIVTNRYSSAQNRTFAYHPHRGSIQVNIRGPRGDYRHHIISEEEIREILQQYVEETENNINVVVTNVTWNGNGIRYDYIRAPREQNPEQTDNNQQNISTQTIINEHRQERRFNILQRERLANNEMNRYMLMTGGCILGVGAAIYFNQNMDIQQLYQQLMQQQLNALFSWESLLQYFEQLGPLISLLGVSAGAYLARAGISFGRRQQARRELRDFDTMYGENLGGNNNARTR